MRQRRPLSEENVEANARLTGVTGALLLIFLFVEGLTILRVHQLIGLHVFLGALLVPLVVLKTGSTSYRFMRYYAGEREFVRRGPPNPILRVTGPLVIVFTFGLLASGIILVVHPRGGWLGIHRIVFIAWFVLMTIHVVGHLAETARLTWNEWKVAARIPGRRLRVAMIAASLIAGVAFGGALLPSAASFSKQRHRGDARASTGVAPRNQEAGESGWDLW